MLLHLLMDCVICGPYSGAQSLNEIGVCEACAETYRPLACGQKGCAGVIVCDQDEVQWHVLDGQWDPPTAPHFPF